VAMGGVTQTMVFSVFTHCSVICVFWHFGGMYCIQLCDDWIGYRWVLMWLEGGSVLII
jgi:hypothetical protein